MWRLRALGADDGPGAEDAGVTSSRIQGLMRSEAKALRATWSPRRQMIADIIETNRYRIAMGVVIGFHTLLIIQETDLRASASRIPAWRSTINYVFLLLYFIDLAVRLYVEQRSFFNSVMNQLDFLVVAADIFSQALTSLVGDVPSFAVLRVCRLSRLLRFARFLRMFRELDIMLMGFLSAMRAMAWATLMIFVILTFFSIIAVELLHPIAVRLTEQGAWKDCERCQRAFSSVMDANLTFMQQILAGDSWGLVSVPIIEEEPLAAVFLIIVLVVVEFGMVNLIVTVIVDVANNAREADQVRKIEEKAREFEDMRQKMLSLCTELDEDGSGDLSVDELLHAMDNNPRFAQIMAALDIEKEDMDVVFRVLDEDHSGTVLYKEFVNQLHKIKSQDTHTLLIFIKGHLNEVRSKVQEQLTVLREEVLASNIDLAHCVRKLLFGTPLLASPSLAPALSGGDATSVALTSAREGYGVRALPPAVYGRGDEIDKAVSANGEHDLHVNGIAKAALSGCEPDLCVGKAANGTHELAANGVYPCCVGDSYVGLIKFEEQIEERLCQLEKQVSGELAQLTREMAAKIDEQLTLMQEWATPVHSAATKGQEPEPSGQDNVMGAHWNASLWEPSQQGALFGSSSRPDLL